MNRVLSVYSLLWFVAWGLALYGALSLSSVSGDWGHSICGAWGCGPPLQALVGCHLAWVVAFLPLTLSWGVFRFIPDEFRPRIGRVLILLGALFLITLVGYQRMMWWPQVSAFQQEFFWQRCGFVIATSVDVPMVQIFLTGIILVWRWRFSNVPPIGNTYSPEVGAVRQQ